MTAVTQYEKALELEASGVYNEAFVLFRNLLNSKNKKDRGDILFHCGWCLENSNNVDRRLAIDYYRQALETTSSLVCRMNSLFRSGWIRMGDKEYQEAVELYKRAIELHQSMDVHNGLYRDASYWFAVCMENMGHYLEALKWYRVVQKIAPLLDPESRFREINCLNRIGAYQEAMEVCRSFESEPPEGFDNNRYNELYSSAKQEQKMIEECLSDNFLETG
jgi:tetratricopeptide (TPR) repeat protein